MQPNRFDLPKFVIGIVDDPEGYRPGRYYVVYFLEQDRKVSRYVRRYETANYKLHRYEARYVKGERNWPEVGRAAELRDSKYVVPTLVEGWRRWVDKRLRPALAARTSHNCSLESGCGFPSYVRLP